MYGEYSNEFGQGECKQCPNGKYVNFDDGCRLAKKDFDSWTDTDAYKKSEFTAKCTKENICKDCATGKGGTGGICYPCEEGSFQDQVGQTSCGGCTAGKYQDDQGSVACKACPVGRYLSVTDGKTLSQCLFCAAGQVQPATGSTSCVACAAGKSKKQTGGTACEACVAGRRASGTGSAACEVCTFGTYQNELSKTSCKNCGHGKFGSVLEAITEGNDEWTLAVSSQTITASAGSVITQGSTTGTLKTTLSGASVTIVIQAAAGVTFVSTTDVVIGKGGTATTVALATITTATKTKFSGCKSCPLGFHQNSEAKIECTACSVGTKGANIWTLAITPQVVTENAGVAVTQGSVTGTLKTLIKEWTLAITAQVIEQDVGTTVTQGSSSGTLKTALSGDSGTIVIQAAAGVTFVTSADVVIGTGDTATTVALATINTASGKTTSVVIKADAGVSLITTADVVIGSTPIVLANINTVGKAISASGGCSNCGNGKYLDQLGQTLCKDCLAGKFGEALGQTSDDSCKDCPEGWNQEKLGMPQCNECGVGFYQSATAKAYW